ncbi:MAG: DNA polymerase I, partial [Chitinophagaceae bacterium]
ADFADYKANRQEAPEDISASIPDIKRMLRAFNIPILESEGFEADDVIGTLSKQAEKLGYEVYMVTPDKDYGQLVSDKVKIYKPGYQGGEVEIMGPEEVCNKWCIKDVSQVIDMLGLMGDAVDNIPGIAGVGEKTACKLLTEFGTLENVLANADGLKGALGEKVRKGKEQALMSKRLATIITDVPVEFHEEDFRLKEWNKDALREVFLELEFRTFINRLLGDNLPDAPARKSAGQQPGLFDAVPGEEPSNNVVTPGKNIGNTPHDYTLVESEGEWSELLAALDRSPEISFDTETTGIDANTADLVGMSFSVETGKGWYVPLPVKKEEVVEILKRFAAVFARPDKL